jgi:hypothetical protein
MLRMDFLDGHNSSGPIFEMATWSEYRGNIKLRERGMKDKIITEAEWKSRWRSANRDIVGIITSDFIKITRISGHAVAGMIMRKIGNQQIVSILKTAKGYQDPDESGYNRYDGDTIRAVVDRSDGCLITVFHI